MNFDMSFDDAKKVFEDFKNSDLRNDIADTTPQIDDMLNLLINGIEALVSGDTLSKDEVMGGGDDRYLSNIIVKLPYYYFCDKYDNVVEFIKALTLVCNNYYAHYNPDSCVLSAIQPVIRVMSVENRVQRMLVAMDYMIAKSDKSREYNKFADTGMSQQFLDSILGNKLDF